MLLACPTAATGGRDRRRRGCLSTSAFRASTRPCSCAGFPSERCARPTLPTAVSTSLVPRRAAGVAYCSLLCARLAPALTAHASRPQENTHPAGADGVQQLATSAALVACWLGMLAASPVITRLFRPLEVRTSARIQLRGRKRAVNNRAGTVMSGVVSSAAPSSDWLH